VNVSPSSPLSADAAARAVATQTLDAVVFRDVLKPLAAALGPVGETVLDTVVDRLFVRPKP
jgi:hypothetical protein